MTSVNLDQKKKIGIAMSGGVDSTATAILVKAQYDVAGFFMNLDQPDYEQQKQRVQAIAEKLEIPLTIIDLSIPFKNKVLEYFSSSYFDGLTPNPCVVCNKEIKFGLFLDAILANECDQVATGHYANISYKDGTYSLKKGLDQTKDQSYFLSRLSQKQLQKVIFPLGSMKKTEIYEFVKSHGFHDFEGKESQDVCFLQKGKVGNYLETFPSASKSTKGDIVNVQGEKLGTHHGLHHYTIGQRKGLGISDTSPYYVVSLSPEMNQVIVGKNEDLFKSTIIVKEMHWLQLREPDLTQEFTIRIRYTHRGSTATVKPLGDNRYELNFTEPQRAVTPGQFGVLYLDDEVIGSGVIE